MRHRSYLPRYLFNQLFTIICYLCAILGIFVLLSILFTLLARGVKDLSIQFLIQPTPPPGVPGGGLSNAIIGSLIITLIAILIATPLGILIATFVVEFSRKSKVTSCIRFTNDVLLSAPSIIMGLFIYAIMVHPLGHFSALAGGFALAMIAIPMIARTTEDVLYLVSPLLRESAIALGVSRWRVTFSIIYRSVRQGIITGVLLALARVMGETAPLLFTALNNQFMSFDLLKPMANLPMVIYRYAMSPYKNWQALAWTGALLITVIVLAVNLFARYCAKSAK